MTRPRFSLSTRGMMALVAVAAVLLSGGILTWHRTARADRHRERVQYHRRRAFAWANLADRLRDSPEDTGVTFYKGAIHESLAFLFAEWDRRPVPGQRREDLEPEWALLVAAARARADYHARLRDEWEASARRFRVDEPIEPPPPPVESPRIRVRAS